MAHRIVSSLDRISGLGTTLEQRRSEKRATPKKYGSV
jgi:hypothetical protein